MTTTVRFATNDPTPWPPEVPAGESAPPGAIIDYYLAANASGAVTLEILDAAGKIVRSYSSNNAPKGPHPALDAATFDKLCQANPSGDNCGLPLYWPAPPIVLGTQQGMHRFSWDMSFDPIGAQDGSVGGGDDAIGAVPHRTYPDPKAPWAPPATYTVRLTANGTRYTQPLVLKLDPRVKTPAADLTRLALLSREMYDGAVASNDAYAKARILSAQLGSAAGSDAAGFKLKVDSIAPTPVVGGQRGFPGARATVGTPTLSGASSAMLAAAMAMQTADAAPTARHIAASAAARAQGAAALARWNALRTGGLTELNAKLRAAGQTPITLSK